MQPQIKLVSESVQLMTVSLFMENSFPWRMRIHTFDLENETRKSTVLAVLLFHQRRQKIGDRMNGTGSRYESVYETKVFSSLYES